MLRLEALQLCLMRRNLAVDASHWSPFFCCIESLGGIHHSATPALNGVEVAIGM